MSDVKIVDWTITNRSTTEDLQKEGLGFITGITVPALGICEVYCQTNPGGCGEGVGVHVNREEFDACKDETTLEFHETGWWSCLPNKNVRIFTKKRTSRVTSN